METITYRRTSKRSIWRSLVAVLVTASLAGGFTVIMDAPAQAAPKKPTVQPAKPSKPSTPAPPKPAAPVCSLNCVGGNLGGGTGTGTKPGTGTNQGSKPVVPVPVVIAPGSAECKKAQYANDARCYNLYAGSADCKTAKWRENPACWYDLTPTPQTNTGIAFFNMETPLVYYSAGKGGGWRSPPTPLPPTSRGGFTATVDKYTGRTVYIPKTNNSYVVADVGNNLSGPGLPTFGYFLGNGYQSYCMSSYKVMPDPDSDGLRRLKQFYAIGVRWTDTLSFSSNGVTSRNINYSCVWPADPQPRTLTCPIWGDGLITGALSNSKGLPLMVNGSPLAVSTTREWNPDKKYTPLGQKRMGVNASGSPKGSPSVYLGFNPSTQDDQYVAYIKANCKDFNYLEAVNLEKCKQVSSGQTLSAADCAIIPGNYNNNFKGQQVLCEYTYYPLLFMGRDAYEAEGCFAVKTPINKTVPITVYCDNTEVVGKHDLSYNFGTCNKPPMTTAMCIWTNGSGAPSITDAKGRAILNGSQVIADGEKYKVTWPAPVRAGARDPWQQWILTSSGGMNPNLAPDDPKQAFFGHYDKTVSANGASGMIVAEGSKKGLPGWTKRDFFFSFFDGAKTNGTSLVPFSVEAQFHFYTTKSVKLDLNGGNTITFDVMDTCRGKEVTFYPLSGRVTQ